MKTSITNRIRSVLDSLPLSIRDARWFMWPLFFVWFRGKNVRMAMDFKKLAPSMNDRELRELYSRVTTLADHRPTDTNAEAMEFVLSRIEGASLLDVGCGRGYFLAKLRGGEAILPVGTGRIARSPLRIGCDLMGGDVIASAEKLPFRTRSFDVVTCFHTLEHTLRPQDAVAELRRVARRQIIVIVPRQKRFEYTLDLHLQFFETPELLQTLMGEGGTIRQFGSDLVYISAP